MALLIFLASLLVVALGNLLILRYLEHVHTWSQRRAIQCLVLALPFLSLGIGVSAFCFQSVTISWMAFALLAPFLLLILVAASAFLFGGMRLALVTYFFARYHGQDDPKLQELSQSLLQKLNLPFIRTLRCPADQPLALIWGFFRPTILISSWMVEHLDPQELEAVLAHELQHVAQQDCLLIWLATMLRDAFLYLPTSRQAYRALQREKELACDDLVVGVTRRPLALASALTKVWLYVLEQGKPALLSGIQSLEGEDTSLSIRIERLRRRSVSMRNESPTNSLSENTSATSLLLLQTIGLLVILAFLGCRVLFFSTFFVRMNSRDKSTMLLPTAGNARFWPMTNDVRTLLQELMPLSTRRM
jgi:hypothetical protein